MKFKIITMDVAKAMPAAPINLDKIMFKIMFRPTQRPLIMSGVAVFLNE